MKKMVFTLALLLMSLSAAVAQTRTFKITPCRGSQQQGEPDVCYHQVG